MENIYKKIRKLRRQSDMTLKDLSEETELSVSFLSQVERGSSSLAITSLKKISDALDTNITYFFEEVETYNYALHKEEQKQFKIEGSDIEYARLAGQFSDRKMEPMMVTVPPNKMYTEKYSHPGEEFYYVISGVVLFKVDEKEYVLNSGDSIHFPSNKVHGWKNPTNEEAVLVSVLTPVIF